MNALIIGIAAFFIAALGALCPHDFVYVPALLSVIVAGGYAGGTIFSLQSEGVYDLRFRESRLASSAGEARLGGIWAYGLVGIPAGAIGLLIAARMMGVNDSAVAELLSSTAGSAGALRRMTVCLGTFAVTVVGGFLGLNLIRVVSDRMKAEIQRQVSGEVAPLRVLEKGRMLMEEHSYSEALDAFRSLARQDFSLLPIVWQGRALKRLGRLSEAIDVLTRGLRTRGPADDHFRRAVALWNLGCYRALLGKGASVSAVIDALDEALRHAPQFRESLAAGALDEDLASLTGNPVFEAWRRTRLEEGAVSDKKTY
jgi:tetratricopeptide (TPR) repeat protein